MPLNAAKRFSSNKAMTFYFSDPEVIIILKQIKNREKSRFVAKAIKDQYQKMQKVKAFKKLQKLGGKLPRVTTTGTEILRKFRSKL